MQNNGYDCGVFICRYAWSMYQLRDQKTTYSDIRSGTTVKNIVNAMPFTDVASLRLVMIDLIKNLSRLYIRDRHLYTCNEQGDLSLCDQGKVCHPPATNMIRKKDVIDDDDDIELLFVPIQLN